MSDRPPSPTTEQARAFVDERLPRSRAVGRELAELIDRPDDLIAAARAAMPALADPGYRAELDRVIPGVGEAFGVRSPLQEAISRPVMRELRRGSSAEAIWLAERLIGAPELEIRSLALGTLRRALDGDPERAWQLIRRLAGRASCWVDVDGLAGVVCAGIMREPYRWAELEQLVYSRNQWERRLVGSSVATLPHGMSGAARASLVATPALSLVESLLGDAEPYVQKSLGWALRSWCAVDSPGVLRLLDVEASRAARTRDGNRAWVIRDSLSALPPSDAAALRARLDGVRRRPGAPSTSAATAVAAPLIDLLTRRDEEEPELRARRHERRDVTRAAVHAPERSAQG